MTRQNWRVAYVSGGASGIGRRLTELLLGQGVDVAVLDLAVGEKVRTEFTSLAQRRPATVSFHEVDIRDTDGVERSVAAAEAALGRPDLAINSAGVTVSKVFAETTADEFERVVTVNLFGSRNFAAAALRRMTRGGRLALISSLSGIVSSYGYTAYNASKFGVVGLAGALRIEYASDGIDVSVICPPEVKTPMVAAERIDGDPVGLELKQFAGSLPLDEACDEIMQGLVAGRPMIIPGRKARFTRHLSRLAPGLANRTVDRMVAKARRKHATQGQLAGR